MEKPQQNMLPWKHVAYSHTSTSFKMIFENFQTNHANDAKTNHQHHLEIHQKSIPQMMRKTVETYHQQYDKLLGLAPMLEPVTWKSPGVARFQMFKYISVYVYIYIYMYILSSRYIIICICIQIYIHIYIYIYIYEYILIYPFVYVNIFLHCLYSFAPRI